jgi:hypothetical protein
MMKTAGFWAVLWGGTLFLAGPPPASATQVSTCTLALTAVVEQQVENSDESLYVSKFVKARITTKDVLNFLAEELTMEFPTDAFLQVDPEGPVHVKTPGGFDQDVSQFFTNTFSINEGISVFSGKYNNDSQAEKSTGLFLITMQIQGQNGDLVRVSGLATEKYNAGAVVEGQQKVVAGITAPVAGSGTVDGETTLISGKLTFKANGYFED